MALRGYVSRGQLSEYWLKRVVVSSDRIYKIVTDNNGIYYDLTTYDLKPSAKERHASGDYLSYQTSIIENKI